MYLDVQHFRLPWPETLDNPEKWEIFWIIEGFRIKLTKILFWEFNYWWILIYYYLPPASKRVELINFSGPNRRFGHCDSADCKQHGTKWSAQGPERVPSQTASRKWSCRCIWYSWLTRNFADYRGFPAMADINWHWISILHVKIHFIHIKKL